MAFMAINNVHFLSQLIITILQLNDSRVMKIQLSFVSAFSHHSLRDTLLGQYWELKLNPQIYADFFSELNEFQIKIIGSEIACMIKDVSHQIIVDESSILP